MYIFQLLRVSVQNGVNQLVRMRVKSMLMKSKGERRMNTGCDMPVGDPVAALLGFPPSMITTNFACLRYVNVRHINKDETILYEKAISL